MKQILGMDAPYGREVDVKPLLHLVEDIFGHATEDTQGQVESLEDKTPVVNFTAISEELAHVVERISCKIVCKVSGESDDQSTSHSIFNMLSSYSWDAKLVLILAAFALNYGEYRLLWQIYSSNRLAKSMAILKHSPVVLQHSGLLEPHFEELKNIVRIMLDFTRCMVEFNEQPPMHISPDVPALSAVMAQMPDAVYWTIRSVVACATQITSLTNMGHENELPLSPHKFAISTMEGLELSIFAHKLNIIYEHLKEQIAICYPRIDEIRMIEPFELIRLRDTPHPQLPSSASPCSKFEFPSTDKNIPKQINCPQCSCAMYKYISFVCLLDYRSPGCKIDYPSTDKKIPKHKNCPKCQRPMNEYTSFICCHDDRPLR